jgi:hypothetical protein
MIETSQDDPESFRDTLDVETLYPHQITPINAHQQSEKQKVPKMRSQFLSRDLRSHLCNLAPYSHHRHFNLIFV